MGIPCDDVVQIQHGKFPGDPVVVTVNCPDKAGLGCDLCRVILQFGLRVTKGDFSTDGRWCYIVLWVVPYPQSLTVDWESLKSHLLAECPSSLFSYYFNQKNSGPSSSSLYLLKVWCLDQKGLLHDVTKVLCKLELTIQRVKVMPTPDGRALDLFFITDGLELLHTKQRRDDICQHLEGVLGKCCITCDLQLAGPEYERVQGFSSLSPAIAEELFSRETLDKDNKLVEVPSDQKVTIVVDNLLSSVHTLLQIKCVDQKGLLYDIMRTSKDCGIQVAHGRFSSSIEGSRNIDLLIQQSDGKKIADLEKQAVFCSRLKEEMLRSLRVTIVNRGPDTELLVANPVELSGKGRPRVFYDVTLALKMLGVCIFSAEITRHSTSGCQWEVYRFLLAEGRELSLACNVARGKIIDRVRKILMGR